MPAIRLTVPSLTLMLLLGQLIAPAPLTAGSSLTTGQQQALLERQLQVRAWRQGNEQDIVEEFADLLRIPNVASDGPNIRRNAEHIQNLLEERGIQAELLESAGSPPAVYGELKVPEASRTVMIYVHYDGQPVQPKNWSSDPWEPVLRDGPLEAGGQAIALQAPFDPEARFYARAAGDDKAPIIGVLAALDALASLGVSPAVNLKLFFEGEEEAGSPHLTEMLAQHAEKLEADLWLICDGPVHQTRRWQLAYGVRGTTGFNLTVYGPTRPLHSGHYGNWAPNPIAMLTQLMASMRDDQGQVMVEGFYDVVTPPSAAELAAIEAAPRVDEDLAEELSLGRVEGDEGRLELKLLQPALNFRGIQAGGVGAQSRNIIVPSASVSIGLRLVPDQQPEAMEPVIRRHLEGQGYFVVTKSPTPEVLREHPRVALLQWSRGGYPALRTPLDDPMAASVASVLQVLSGGQLVQQPTMGGSLPLYRIREQFDVPIIILPIANHDNNQHGENENLRLQNLWDGIEIYAGLLSTPVW